MPDIREETLVRLLAIAEGTTGIARASRNDQSVGEASDDRPAIQIFDGDEITDESDPVLKRPLGQPRRVRMSPEIWIMAGSLPENIGTSLNTLRARFLRALLTDSALQAVLDQGQGTIIYDGCATTVTRGRTSEGELKVLVSFAYILTPGALPS